MSLSTIRNGACMECEFQGENYDSHMLCPCGQKTRTTLKWRLKILHRLPLRMDFSDPQAAPTISLSRSYRIQGNLRCFGRASSPMSPEQNQELLLRNEYLAVENRILRGR